MNARNKKLVTTARIIFGLFILFSGVSGLMAVHDISQIPEPMQPSTVALIQYGIFYLIKCTEVVVGLMFLFNFLPQLAAIFFAPIAIGILVYTGFVAPAYMVTGLIVTLFNIYFGYVYWEKYKPLFSRA